MPREYHAVFTEPNTELPKINPSSIPDCDYEIACAVLFSSISRALSDPQCRKEYETWKAERNAG